MGNTKEGFPKSSTFKVTATESSSNEVPVPNARTLTSLTYTVRWHLPIENYVRDTSLPVVTSVSYDKNASGWVPVNTNITITLKPANRWLQIGAVGGSAAVNVTAAVVGSGVIWGASAMTAGTAGVLTAIGIALASSAPQDDTRTENFAYTWYSNAVDRQRDINNGVPGTQNDYQRVYPANLVNNMDTTAAGNSFRDYQWQYGNLKGRVVIARPWQMTPMIGDAWDHNGYAGRAKGTDKAEGTHAYLYQIWKPTGQNDPDPDPAG